MIIELRSNRLKPGSVPTVEERYGNALHGRNKLSPLGGFWHSETGTLNNIFNIWPFESYAERERIRSEWTNVAGWPPPIEEDTRLLRAAPFCPPIEERHLGGVYEMCIDTYAARTIPKVIAYWQEKIEARQRLSPLVMCAFADTGVLNQLVHIWAYRDLQERQRVRAEAVDQGIWPPKSHTDGLLLKQENVLMTPASFSPLR